jgi:hypothetical protein
MKPMRDAFLRLPLTSPRICWTLCTARNSLRKTSLSAEDVLHDVFALLAQGRYY